jgi:hypothetical protein
MVLETLLYFALLLMTTTVFVVLPGTINARFWVTLPACALALAATAAAFVGIEPDGPGASTLTLIAVLLVVLMRGPQPRWSFLGARIDIACG